MIGLPSRPALQSASLVPVTTGLLCVLLDVVALPGIGRPPTFLALVAVLFWSVRRGGWFTSGAALVCGLAGDTLGGLPLGASALALLLGREGVLLAGPLLVSDSPIVRALPVLAVAGGALFVRWAVVAAWLGASVPFDQVLFEAVATLAAWPVLAFVLDRIDRRLPEPNRAA